MTCKNCGANNADNSKYCGYCGSKFENLETIESNLKIIKPETIESLNSVVVGNNVIKEEQQKVDISVEQKSTSAVKLSSNNTEDNKNEFSSKNKKKKTPIVAILILVLFIVGIALVALKFGNFNNNTSGKVDESLNEISWNGIYENESGTIYVYKLNDTEISFNAQIDGAYYQGTAYINGNIAEGQIFNTYTFKLNGANLEFSSDDNDVKSGVFVKTKNYTKEDYYKENYGDPKFLETVFNGIFEKDGTTISIYQTNEETVSIRILNGMSLYSRNLTISGNELVYENEAFGEISKINITVTENELNIVSSSTDEGSLLNKVSGTYPKTKNYALDDILNNQW